MDNSTKGLHKKVLLIFLTLVKLSGFIQIPALASIDIDDESHHFESNWETERLATGSHILTSQQLMATFDGKARADTFVWQRQEVEIYDVRFLMNDGRDDDVVTTLRVVHGQSIRKEDLPDDPTRIGFIFQGWGLSADATYAVDFEKIAIVEATDFYAIWSSAYVDYVFDWRLEGVENSAGQVRADTTPIPPSVIPDNPGYLLEGWNPEVGSITENTTFTAHWTPEPTEPSTEPSTKPSIPTGSSQPTVPSDPSTPSCPTIPSDSSTPNDSSTTSRPGDQAGNNNNVLSNNRQGLPQTGTAAIGTALIGSIILAIAAGLVIARRKKN